MTLIDGHTHLFAPGQCAAREALCARDATFAELYRDPRAKLATAADLLQALDGAGIDAAVAAGFAFVHEGDLAEQNEYLLAAAAEGQGRIIPLATVNPALAGWRPLAERALATGARGFGELRPGNQGWDPLGPEGSALCGLAREAGAVLLWHVSEPVGHAYPGKRGGISPGDLYRVAEAWPGLSMIAAHYGGGLPFYLQMPEARGVLANTYFDTAAWSLLYDDDSVARLVDLAGPGRVIFGSDYPLLSPGRQLQRLRALLPAAAVEAVCGRTAATLFGISHDA